MIDAVDSAMPSISPTAATLRPSVPTMNSGSKAWMISDDRSIARLTKPSATTERGRAGRELTGLASSQSLPPP